MTAKAETAASVATSGSALMLAAIVDSRLLGVVTALGFSLRSSWIPSAAAIGAGEDFQEVTVRILEIDSAAAIIVIDFTRLGFGGIGPIGTPPLSNPSKNFVELSLTHKKGIVLRFYFAISVHESTLVPLSVVTTSKGTHFLARAALTCRPETSPMRRYRGPKQWCD